MSDHTKKASGFLPIQSIKQTLAKYFLATIDPESFFSENNHLCFLAIEIPLNLDVLYSILYFK